jgi:hypothetical protein
MGTGRPITNGRCANAGASGCLLKKRLDGTVFPQNTKIFNSVYNIDDGGEKKMPLTAQKSVNKGILSAYSDPLVLC